MTPKEIGTIVSAYTGFLCCNFSDLQLYADKLLGRQTWTHEFGGEQFADQLKEKATPDFVRLAEWCSSDR